MRVVRSVIVLVAVVAVLLSPAVSAQRPSPTLAHHQPTIASILKPGLPSELVSARKVDRIAWIAYEEGKRNVFTAAAPLFTPVRVTSFLKDDGVDLTGVKISDDGSTVIFIRGSAPNRQGWVANPAGDPAGGAREIWGAKVATPGVAWRLAEGNNPEVAPDGSSVLYMKDGQIYRAKVGPGPQVTPIEKGEKPFINAWGLNSGPRFSPDGTRIAFSTNRSDHSFIGIYNFKTKLVTYLAPGVDCDSSPTWSPDGKQIAFLRRPGLPFGRQSTPGGGSGLPEAAANGGRGGGGGGFGGGGGCNGAGGVGQGRGRNGGAAAPANAPTQAAAQQQTGGRQGGGRGGRGGNAAGNAAPAQQTPPPDSALLNSPGFYRGQLAGGNTLGIMIADMATGEAKQVWQPKEGDNTIGNINSIQWVGDNFIFTQPAQGNEEGNRYYSMSVSGTGTPVRLNTTEGIVEDATAATFSKDGKTFFYCTNANDIDRRHIWAVPASGGTPKQITTGDGIENVPVALASGKYIATMSADAKRPMGIGVWPSTSSPASAQKVIYPKLGADFPMSSMVAPTNVTLKADDGQEFHNQLFLPKDIKPGERRPAMIFVHGGPARQMLLGWHYLNFYHVFYGVNEWLTSQGYIVMSVNYRLGIGYGSAFRQAGGQGGARGNAEYRDVLAAGKWLAAREDVDPNRVGIWGLSYGGLLTAEALARNSDLFKYGVDLAGVHLEGNSLDPESVSFKASSISEIDKWKSPVLLFQGDDDRNVNFAQMVGLVNLLRARNVYHELYVFPDDVHETLLHSRWLFTFDKMEAFLNKFAGENTATRAGGR